MSWKSTSRVYWSNDLVKYKLLKQVIIPIYAVDFSYTNINWSKSMCHNKYLTTNWKKKLFICYVFNFIMWLDLLYEQPRQSLSSFGRSKIGSHYPWKRPSLNNRDRMRRLSRLTTVIAIACLLHLDYGQNWSYFWKIW